MPVHAGNSSEVRSQALWAPNMPLGSRHACIMPRPPLAPRGVAVSPGGRAMRSAHAVYWGLKIARTQEHARSGRTTTSPDGGLVSTLATFSDARYSIAVSPDGAFALMVDGAFALIVVGISNGGRILKITLANNNVTTLIVAGSGSVKGYADGLTVLVRMRNSLTTACMPVQIRSHSTGSQRCSQRPMPCRCMC